MIFRIYKAGDFKDRNWMAGTKANAEWEPSVPKAIIPPGKAFVTIEDGKLGNFRVVFKQNGTPVPAQEIAKAFLAGNFQASNEETGAIIPRYGREWFFDYDPSIEDFLVENKLPLRDKKPYHESFMEGYVADGIRRYGLTGAAEFHSPGQKAILEAKKAAEKARAEAEEAKAELAELKAKSSKATNKEKPSTIEVAT